jgi:hypothetical protein
LFFDVLIKIKFAINLMNIRSAAQNLKKKLNESLSQPFHVNQAADNFDYIFFFTKKQTQNLRKQIKI